VKESVLETLSAHPKHSDIRDKLDQVIRMGYMVKVGTSEFKFVHDKVREAAYSLFPEQDRDLVSGRSGDCMTWAT
jgi:predicted ATPase